MKILTSLFLTFFFFFNDTATTEIYTLSLHDALPISRILAKIAAFAMTFERPKQLAFRTLSQTGIAYRESPLSKSRSEEHTSELQSQSNLVCRLLLEKKKNLITSDRARTARTAVVSDH